MVGLCLAVVEGLFATIPYILLIYFLLIDLFANKITLAQLFYYFFINTLIYCSAYCHWYL